MSWNIDERIAGDIRERLRRIPRLRAAHLPTALEDCPRLSRALGGPAIFIKRDDCTGVALGGNKTRQLEFVIGDAVRAGADTIVTGSGSQSNWCRQAVAMARKAGLRTSLVLASGEKGRELQGNLLLDRVFGADVAFIDTLNLHDVEPALVRRKEELRLAGAKPYLMSPFALETKSLAALGYVEAFLELQEQVVALGSEPTHIYVPGANITPAGLLVGVKSLCVPVAIVNISPVRWDEDRRVDIARVACAAAERLSVPGDFQPADVINEDGYVGDRYGHLDRSCMEAIRLVAETEGIVLDPVYSGKGMAGLIDHIRTGRLTTRDTAIFLHTGGTPALFAYSRDIDAALCGSPLNAETETSG